MLRRSLRLLAAFLMMQASRFTSGEIFLDEFMTTGSTIQIGLRKLPMTSSRALLAIILLACGRAILCAEAEPRSPQGGFYEITVRLELPHLERWGVDKTTIICFSRSRNGDEIPIPVLSANNPFAKCTSANLVADDRRFQIRHSLPWTRSGQGSCRLYVLSRNILWPCRDGDGRKKYDNDGNATRPPDRPMQPGDGEISSQVLKATRRMDPKEQNAMVHSEIEDQSIISKSDT